jgi:hypothetical protein
MMRLYTIIKDETPEQYTFNFALWTIEIIREVIKRTGKVPMVGMEEPEGIGLVGATAPPWGIPAAKRGSGRRVFEESIS